MKPSINKEDLKTGKKEKRVCRVFEMTVPY
jgi:hypothetical protein